MAGPKYSIQEWIAIDLPFDAELDAFERGGAEGVGLSFFTGPRARRPSIAEMAEMLDDSSLTVTACWPQVPSFLAIPGFSGPTEPTARTRKIVEFIRAVAVLRPQFIGCVTGPAGTLSSEDARAAVIAGLTAVSRAAQAIGARVVIEPVHSTNAELFSIVTSLSQVVEIIDAVGEPNVGMVFDMWHSCEEPNLLADIARYGKYIDLVHLSDWRDPTRSWCDRALPGEGVADVVGMLGALDDAGYDGWYELEVLSDDGTYEEDFADSLWHLDPESLVRRARLGFLEAWNLRKHA